MGKSKTAQRVARKAGEVKQQAPPKPKRHPWFKNRKFHHFEGKVDCVNCGFREEEHGPYVVVDKKRAEEVHRTRLP